MKKSKTTLTLMEQLIMIAVFAVAVAVCLRVFAFANSRSEQNLINDVAVNESRNAAEVIKSTGGDFVRAAEILGALPTENGLEKELSGEYGSLLLTSEKLQSAAEGLGNASVTVSDPETGRQVFSITVCWQEAMP